MSLTFLPPGDAFMPTMTERFAEAEKIEDRAARWTAQAEIALDTGDMYLVGLVLFKAIQEFGVDTFAEYSGEPQVRLQRLWMPGMVGSVDHAKRLFGHLGVSLPVDRFYAARLEGMSADGAVVH
nr:hypothetical protein [uncultured Cupriavidus sp.]